MASPRFVSAVAVEAGEEPWAVRQMSEEAHADDLLGKPGNAGAISNIGCMLLRFAPEVSEGADPGEVVNRRLARSLGLKTVRLARTPRDSGRRPAAPGHG